MTNKERKLRAFEAVAIAASSKMAEHMPTTPEIEAEVERLYAAGRRMLAKSRYDEAVRTPVQYASNTIRPEVLAMSRADMNTLYAQLKVTYPMLHNAHRDGDNLSDHDLRAMLEDALRLTKDLE